MTELTFLLELTLEDEIPKDIKKRIIERIREVEANLSSFPQRPQPQIITLPPAAPPQAVAATPAAALALQQRAEMMRGAAQGEAVKSIFKPKVGR